MCHKALLTRTHSPTNREPLHKSVPVSVWRLSRAIHSHHPEWATPLCGLQYQGLGPVLHCSDTRIRHISPRDHKLSTIPPSFVSFDDTSVVGANFYQYFKGVLSSVSSKAEEVAKDNCRRSPKGDEKQQRRYQKNFNSKLLLSRNSFYVGSHAFVRNSTSTQRSDMTSWCVWWMAPTRIWKWDLRLWCCGWGLMMSANRVVERLRHP